MTDFVVVITDPAQLAGITWAREEHNASLLPPLQEADADGNPVIQMSPASLTLETDQDYIQWLIEQAAASYAIQQEQAAWRQAYEAAQASGRAGKVTPPPLPL